MSENNTEHHSEHSTKNIEYIDRHLAEIEEATQSKYVDLSKQFFSLQSLVKELNTQIESNEELYAPLVNWSGYTLLLLSLFYNISIFIPFGLMNPLWELQTIASLVDNIPMFLLGLILAFYGKHPRKKLEKFCLSIASWLSLLVGILFLLLIPLGIADTIRISSQNYVQSNNQVTQQTTQLENLKQQLNNASSPEEIAKVIGTISRQAPIIDNSNTQELKKQVLSQIAKAELAAKTTSETRLKDQQLNLFKNSVRYLLGALVCGALFIYAWRITFLIIKFVMA